MACKTYEPVRVVNPGEGHLVPLLPNQDFIVFIDDVCVEEEFESQFFELKLKEIGKNSTTLHFRQKFNLKEWGNISKVHLGEVYILTEDYFGSLCVFLDTTNKMNSRIITVINPENDYLKVDPANIAIIEVVVFDDNENWDCTVISGESGLQLAQFDYKKIDPFEYCCPSSNVYQSCSPYPRANFLLEKSEAIFEHHYWFRFASPTSIYHMTPGIYAAGKIIIDDTDSVYRVLNVDIRVKGKNKIFETNRRHLLMPSIIKKTPRDSIFKQNISFKKKDDSELHSDKVIYM